MNRSTDPLNYQSPVERSRLSGLGIASMIFGIIAIPTIVIGWGFLFAIVAIITGVLSIRNINAEEGRLAGKGFALAGIVEGVSVILLGFTLIYLASSPRAMAVRTYCASNLNGITKSMLVYANDYGDCLPCPPAGTSTPAYSAVTYDPRKTAGNNNSLAVLAILVAQGMTDEKTFICKSDPFVSSTPGTFAASGVVNIAPLQNSYSLVSPWSTVAMSSSTGGWWRSTNIDSELPLLADMVLSGPPLPGKIGNTSMNHNCDGQNIAYSDAHVEWERRSTFAGGTLDIRSTLPNPIPDVRPYNVWMTPHRTTAGFITTP